MAIGGSLYAPLRSRMHPADLTGEWFTWIVPISIGGSLILGSWVLDYLLALVFGIGFQYAAIRSMHRISRVKRL